MDDDLHGEDREVIKVVLLGDSGVGKSSILQRFVHEKFSRNMQSTVGACYLTRNMDLPEVGRKLTFQIWDTAGQEKYRSLAPMFYRHAQIAIIVFDVTNQNSFNAVKYWESELRNAGPDNYLLIVCANKCDLEHKIDLNLARQTSHSLGALFFETSAKSGVGIDELFFEAGQRIKPQVEASQSSSETLSLRPRAPAPKNGCAC